MSLDHRHSPERDFAQLLRDYENAQAGRRLSNEANGLSSHRPQCNLRPQAKSSKTAGDQASDPAPQDQASTPGSVAQSSHDAATGGKTSDVAAGTRSDTSTRSGPDSPAAGKVAGQTGKSDANPPGGSGRDSAAADKVPGQTGKSDSGPAGGSGRDSAAADKVPGQTGKSDAGSATGKGQDNPTGSRMQDSAVTAGTNGDKRTPRTADAGGPTRDVGREVTEKHRSAHEKTERVLTGMLVSPDLKSQVGILGNKIYTGSKSPEFVGDLDSDGIIHRPDGRTTTINNEFGDWQFRGKSYSKDGQEARDRVFTVSSLTCNGDFFSQQGEGKPPKRFDVEMGAVVDPESGAQLGFIKPPIDYGGRLFGGELTLFSQNGGGITAPLSRFENCVFNLKLLGETGIDGKPIAGICKGQQPNGREEFVNLTENHWQAALAKAKAETKVEMFKTQTGYGEYLKVNKTLTDAGYSEEEKERVLTGTDRYASFTQTCRVIERAVKPWEQQERQASAIEGQCERILANPVVDANVIRTLERSSELLREMVLGSPLAAARDKLDREASHPELEKLPPDSKKLFGKADTAGEAFTINQGKLVNAKGEEMARIDPSNNTLIVKGEASVKDGKLVINKSQPKSDQQQIETVSIVPMGLLTGANWKLQWEGETGQQRSVSWMSLGPEYNNQIASLAVVMKSSYAEGRYADAVDREAKSEGTAKILLETKARQSKFETRALDIFTSNRTGAEDVAYIADGASRHVREAAWQQPLALLSHSAERGNEEAKIAKVENGRLRRGNEYYDIEQGGRLSVTVGDHNEVVGQLLAGNNIFLKGRGQISLDLENQVLLELTSNGQTEAYIGTGPHRATANLLGHIGGLMPLSQLQSLATQLADRTSAASKEYVDRTANATRALGESEVLLGKRGEQLSGIAESAGKDKANLSLLTAELLRDGFKRDSNGQFILANDHLNTKVGIIQSTEAGLLWGAREAEALSQKGQEFQRYVTSGVKSAAIMAVTCGVVNPAFTALAETAQVSSLALIAGEIGTTSLVGGLTALCVDDAPSSNPGLVFAGGLGEGATQGLSAFARVMGTGLSVEQARIIAQLSQSGGELSIAEARLASTAVAKLVASGGGPTEVAALKLLYNGIENGAQAIGFAATDKIKNGTNPFAGLDSQTLILGTVAGMLGDGAANGTAKFMESTEGKSLMHRVTNAMVPRVIEEFNEQLAIQDRKTAAAMRLDVKLVSQEVLEKNRDLGAALSAAVESAAPAGLAAVASAGLPKLKEHQGPRPQLPSLAGANERSPGETGDGIRGTSARDGEGPSTRPVVVHGGERPQGPHGRRPSAGEPDYVGVGTPRRPEVDSMGAQLSAATTDEGTAGRERAEASPRTNSAANGTAAMQQRQPGPTTGAQSGGQGPAGDGGRASNGNGINAGGTQSLPDGGHSDLRASSEGGPANPAAADESVPTPPPSRIGDTTVVRRAASSGGTDQAASPPKRINTWEGRDFKAEATSDAVKAAGPQGDRNGIKAQQAAYEAADAALGRIVINGQTAREADWCVLQTAPGSAADKAKIDMVLFNRKTKQWYPLDTTCEEKLKAQGIQEYGLIELRNDMANNPYDAYWTLNKHGTDMIVARLTEILSRPAPFCAANPDGAANPDRVLIPPPRLDKTDAATTYQSVEEFVDSLRRSGDPEHSRHAVAVAGALDYLRPLAQKERDIESAKGQGMDKIKALEDRAIRVLDQAMQNLFAAALSGDRKDPKPPGSVTADLASGRAALCEGGVTIPLSNLFSGLVRAKAKIMLNESMNNLPHGESSNDAVSRLTALFNTINGNPGILFHEIAEVLSEEPSTGKVRTGDLPPTMVFIRPAPGDSPTHTFEPIKTSFRSAKKPNGGATGDTVVRGSAGVAPTGGTGTTPSKKTNGDKAAGATGDSTAKIGDELHVDAPKAPAPPYMGDDGKQALIRTVAEFGALIDQAKLHGKPEANIDMEGILNLARNQDGLSQKARSQLNRLYDDYINSHGAGNDRTSVVFVNELALAVLSGSLKPKDSAAHPATPGGATTATGDASGDTAGTGSVSGTPTGVGDSPGTRTTASSGVSGDTNAGVGVPPLPGSAAVAATAARIATSSSATGDTTTVGSGVPPAGGDDSTAPRMTASRAVSGDTAASGSASGAPAGARDSTATGTTPPGSTDVPPASGGDAAAAKTPTSNSSSSGAHAGEVAKAEASALDPARVAELARLAMQPRRDAEHADAGATGSGESTAVRTAATGGEHRTEPQGPHSTTPGSASGDSAATGSAAGTPATGGDSATARAATSSGASDDTTAPGSARVSPAARGDRAAGGPLPAGPPPPLPTTIYHTGPLKSEGAANVGDKARSSEGGAPPLVGATSEKRHPVNCIEEPAWSALRNTFREWKDEFTRADVSGDSKNNESVAEILKFARDKEGLDPATKKQLSDLYDDYNSYKTGGDRRSVVFVNAVALEVLRSSAATELSALSARPDAASKTAASDSGVAKPPAGPPAPAGAASYTTVPKPSAATDSTATRPAPAGFDHADAKAAAPADTGQKISRAEALTALGNLISADATLNKTKLKEVGDDPAKFNLAVPGFLRAAAEHLRGAAEQLTEMGRAYAQDPAVREEVNKAIAKAAKANEGGDSVASVADKSVPAAGPAPAPSHPVIRTGAADPVDAQAPGAPKEVGAVRAPVPTGAKERAGDGSTGDQKSTTDRTRTAAEAGMEAWACAIRNNKVTYPDLSKVAANPNTQHFDVHQILRIAAKNAGAGIAGDYLRQAEADYKHKEVTIRRVREINNLIARAYTEAAPAVTPDLNTGMPKTASASDGIDSGPKTVSYTSMAAPGVAPAAARPAAMPVPSAEVGRQKEQVREKGQIKVPTDAEKAMSTATEAFKDTIANNQDKNEYQKDLEKLIDFPEQKNDAVERLLGLAANRSAVGNQLRVMQAAYRRGVREVVEEANRLVLEVLTGPGP